MVGNTQLPQTLTIVFKPSLLLLLYSEYEAAKMNGLQPLLRRLLSPKSHSFWKTHVYMLQVGTGACVWGGGGKQRHMSTCFE
jgi:hypothetical protein